jgi:uncharacterized protein with NRDE domain
MCSIFLAYRVNSFYRMIVAANRDEFFDRPTAPAGFWSDAYGVLAGRDLRGGGTWLGLGPGRRFAAVTNFRDPAAPTGSRSRGQLVADFITGKIGPARYVSQVVEESQQYSGFNLFAADADELWYFSNRGGAPRRLEPGVYGLSNHLLDTPWPKVSRGTARMSKIVGSKLTVSPEVLFDLLADDAQAPDEELPDTGIGIERERALSPIFIRTPDYGTRSATALLIKADESLSFNERTFNQPSISHFDRHFEIPPAMFV